MKYAIVYLSLIILILYAAFDYQLDKSRDLITQAGVMKNMISVKYADINKLTDFRKSLKPPENPLYPWPMLKDEYHDLTSYFGPRNNPLKNNTGGADIKFHAAIDMRGVRGAQVLAVSDGIVLDKWYDAGWHNGRKYGGHDVFNGYVIILHDNGMISHYGHISDILIHEDDRVTAGQPIGRISDYVDIFSTGRHLDFRVQDKNGEFVNPLLWIGENKNE